MTTIQIGALVLGAIVFIIGLASVLISRRKTAMQQ